MFSAIRRWRRRRWRTRPFPPEWQAHLDGLGFYQRMSEQARARLRDNVKLFAWEKRFVGAGGLEVTDEMQVVIAAAAARLIQFLDLSFYDRLSEIVVYPYDYRHPGKENQVILGEAHRWGVVVLSWPAVLRGLANPCDGWDTALHEFAHVLDQSSGTPNGTPPLRADDHYRPWAEVMSHNFLSLRDSRTLRDAVLRTYGAKNEAEFFAVATEAFFERPRLMKTLMPDLYSELERFYGFDATVQSAC